MRRRADFLAARRGERRGGPLFSIEVLDRGRPDAPPRLGLTVTKKVGNAVLRNRIRRRLREAVRTEVARDMKPGHDYVIVARAEVATEPFGALVEALRERVRRAPRPSGPPRGKRRAKGGSGESAKRARGSDGTGRRPGRRSDRTAPQPARGE